MKAMQFSKASQAWLALFCDCPLCLYFLTSLQTLPVCFCSLLVHRLVSFSPGPAIHIKFSTSPLDDNSCFSCPLSSYRLFLMCLRHKLLSPVCTLSLLSVLCAWMVYSVHFTISIECSLFLSFLSWKMTGVSCWHFMQEQFFTSPPYTPIMFSVFPVRTLCIDGFLQLPSALCP